ncbi:unnamed protein product [Lampetra planeri]
MPGHKGPRWRKRLDHSRGHSTHARPLGRNAPLPRVVAPRSPLIGVAAVLRVSPVPSGNGTARRAAPAGDLGEPHRHPQYRGAMPRGIGSANTQVTLLRVDSEQSEGGRSGGHSLEVLLGNSGGLRQKGQEIRWRARDLPGSVQESKTLPHWEPSLPDCSDCGSLALSTLPRAAPAPKGRPIERETTAVENHVDRNPHRRRNGDDATCSEE